MLMRPPICSRRRFSIAQTYWSFRVGSDDLAIGANKPVQCASGDAALVRGLHAIATDDRFLRSSPSANDRVADQLRQLHRLLSRYGMEFGHRTFYESLRFAELMQVAGAVEGESTLDRIVVQRILPRLHGARRRLETPLLALAYFARDLPGDVPPDEKLAALNPERVAEGLKAKLPASHEKIARMLRSLRANQFASFTE